jgi:hypothetical protein
LLNNRIFTLLQDYSILQDDWDGDDSLAPTENVTQDAFYLSLLMEKTGQRIFHTAPGPSGEIMLDLRNEETQRSVEIIFYPKKSIFVTFSESDVPRQGIFSFELLPELLEWLNLSANV